VIAPFVAEVGAAAPVTAATPAAAAPGAAAAPPFCWDWACSRRLAFCSSTLWTRFG